MTTVEQRRIAVGNVVLNVASVGAGPPIVLLHGWPHTWRVWRDVMARLGKQHLVIAPDLRGAGASSRPAGGYDLHTLAADVDGLLAALDVSDALVVGIDAGVAIAWMTAARHPARVRRLAVMEGLLGRLAGAGRFLTSGPPWWFGFHAVDGLAESVIEGHEDRYIGWFLDHGVGPGTTLDPGLRAELIAAYTGCEALRSGFAHYRRTDSDAEQIASAIPQARGLATPTLAISGGVVGDAVFGQLAPFTPDLRRLEIPGCGHLVPIDAPAALARALHEFSIEERTFA